MAAHIPAGSGPVYEARNQKPLDRGRFYKRLAWHALLLAALIGISLFGGMLGYVMFEHLSWLDAFLNASMLLGGMGPVNAPVHPAGKLFAGLYALYSGLLFLVAAALVFAPLLHRIMHRLHWDEREK
jgi:hypothetical protein